MSHKSVGLVGARLVITTGSEGPDWDPYHYTEFSHESHDRVVTFHSGALYESVKVNDKIIVENGEPLLRAEEIWKRLTGFYSWQWQFFIYKLRKKCRKCGDKRSRWESGMPGESFKVCMRCDKVIEVDFNENAII